MSRRNPRNPASSYLRFILYHCCSTLWCHRETELTGQMRTLQCTLCGQCTECTGHHFCFKLPALHTSSRTFIDQVDIDIKNICSGFSYCVSILDTLFIWHGCGSTPTERKAAIEYAQTLTSNPDSIVVLIENENDDDEMFWMVLGEEAEYAKADYWKWRSSTEFTPRIWSVEAGRQDAVYTFLRRFHCLD